MLHALRLGGVLDTEAAAERLGVGAGPTRVVLDRLRVSSLVVHRGGSFAGWSLTASGRCRGEELLAEEVDALGARGALESAYEGFLLLNGEILGVCTDWQVVRGGAPNVLNDHSDSSYDSEVLARLESLHDRATSVLAPLEEALTRFRGYRPRLGTALRRALGGEVDWVTRPMIDSYHTVWFELHEDLLASLGRQRQDERNSFGAPGHRGRSMRAERGPGDASG